LGLIKIKNKENKKEVIMFSPGVLDSINNQPQIRDSFLRRGPNMQLSMPRQVKTNLRAVFGLGEIKFGNNKRIKIIKSN
jgi:hypothetical protein